MPFSESGRHFKLSIRFVLAAGEVFNTNFTSWTKGMTGRKYRRGRQGMRLNSNVNCKCIWTLCWDLNEDTWSWRVILWFLFIVSDCPVCCLSSTTVLDGDLSIGISAGWQSRWRCILRASIIDCEGYLFDSIYILSVTVVSPGIFTIMSN
jgi:hypothetical protein